MAEAAPRPPGLPAGAAWLPSPNHGARRDTAPVDMVILHYTAMADARAALDRLSDPEAEVSAHYLVARDGSLAALVAEDRRAWHAGQSFWAGEEDVNSRSIGIELDHPGRDGDGVAVPFAAAQMTSLEWLLEDILERHGIAPARVLGHACVAPGRKQDPGPAFDWRRLARTGLAVWADPAPGLLAETGEGDAAAFRDAARALGMALEADAAAGWDDAARAAWAALAARFLPMLAHRPVATAGAVRHLAALAAEHPGRPAGA